MDPTKQSSVKYLMSTKILSEPMMSHCWRVIELSLSPEGEFCQSSEQDYKLRVAEDQVYTSVNDGTASPV